MLAERENEMKAAAASGPVLLPQRRMIQSTVLQDLGPLSSLTRIENSRHSNQTRFRSLRNVLLFLLLWNAKPWIPKIRQYNVHLNDGWLYDMVSNVQRELFQVGASFIWLTCYCRDIRYGNVWSVQRTAIQICGFWIIVWCFMDPLREILYAQGQRSEVRISYTAAPLEPAAIQCLSQGHTSGCLETLEFLTLI